MTPGIQNPLRDGQNLRIVGLLAAFVGSMAYSLFLAGATHDLPSIWTANAVMIAGLLSLTGGPAGCCWRCRPSPTSSSS